ncbi:MAG: bifunctional tetrahydrofolate synthase/dihydrofolate synthase [Thiobacillus sp.]
MPPEVSLEAWLARLEQLHPQAIDLGLDRVRRVAQTLDIQPAFPIIIVGGTNGKGSTCAYLEAMLGAAGYKTGLYTSPHLLRYNERVRIAGAESSDTDLIHAFERIEGARGETSLTYYEFGTLGAMLQFIDAGVNVAILEVGLGGRLDAVNMFDADAALVTSVDLDHQQYLGDTRELIGLEKAGIYRAHRPAVCADPVPPISLLGHIDTLQADAWLLGKDFDFEATDLRWSYRGREWQWLDLPLPQMAGMHQLRNAAGAIAVLEAMQSTLPLDRAAIAQGLNEAHVTGRFQRIGSAPEIVLDVAHNPEAARALASTLLGQPARGRTWAVFGILADKDAAAVIAPLSNCFDGWFVCTPDTPRALGASSLAEQLRSQLAGASQAVEVSVCASPEDALDNALNHAAVDDRIVAFGSFYTVAAVLQHARSHQ